MAAQPLVRDGWGTTLTVLVLTLGSRLHIDGHVLFPLPRALFGGLPVLDNVLLNRFSLPLDLGLAAIVAVFTDRVLSCVMPGGRAAGLAMLAALAVSLWPSGVEAPLLSIPAYLQAGGDVARFPVGTAALVFPVPYPGPVAASQASVWQAVSDFRLRLFSALSISSNAVGRSSFGSTVQPLTRVARSLQLTGDPGRCDASPTQVAAQMTALGIHLVVLGPAMPHAAAVAAYVTSLADVAPSRDQGVLTWELPG